ncbi:MAG: SDR family NAD(P)-dependent oxidoreductase [Thalassovita sp.]
MSHFQDRLTLKGKRVLITGASSGIGAHLAQFAAAQGADVLLAARRVEKLRGVAQTIASDGGTATPHALDITDVRAVEELMVATEIDVLVNNAGIGQMSSAHGMDEAEFDHLMSTNLKGAWSLSRAAAKSWIAHETKGVIVNVSSILGARVASQVSIYATSKAAMNQMTKAQALEWARYGIRVNALAPGYVTTELNADFFASEPGQKLINRIPMRRLGQYQELEGPFLMLASDAGSFMTGAVIPVDGGHLVSSL